MFGTLRNLQCLRVHTVWAMEDDAGGTPNTDPNGMYGPMDWHCYAFNRHDDWTDLHDWGCFNWNKVSHMHRRQDPKEKDLRFF